MPPFNAHLLSRDLTSWAIIRSVLAAGGIIRQSFFVLTLGGARDGHAAGNDYHTTVSPFCNKAHYARLSSRKHLASEPRRISNSQLGS